jgi:hypothetical protein
VDAILSGIGFAIGLVIGLVMIFFAARWLRCRYYRASKQRGDDLPADIRAGYIKDALKDYQRARRKGLSPEQAREAYGNLMVVAQDNSLPLDQKTRDAVGKEVIAMMKIATATKPR